MNAMKSITTNLTTFLYGPDHRLSSRISVYIVNHPHDFYFDLLLDCVLSRIYCLWKHATDPQDLGATAG